MASASSEQQSNNDNFKLKGVYEMLEKVNVPETPPWRKNNESPSISQMLKGIVDGISDHNPNTQQYETNLLELKIRYVLSSNQGEDEGTKTLESTKIALNKNKSEAFSLQEQVSLNLYNAIQHLEERNLGNDRGLLDVEECIQDTHKILMENLLEPEKCGKFSTDLRRAGDHYFPVFNTENHAYDEVSKVIDQYNTTIEYIKQSDLDPIKQNSMYIRCAAWILYHFVSLHPFADGNGRMCRLLASHCLYLVFPFPCPIYNIYAPTDRKDYLDAINRARKTNDKDLGELIALIIESGWHTSKFLQTSETFLQLLMN